MTWLDPIHSDKHYWHRYSQFYRPHFESLSPVTSILEYGVFKGASIRWLRSVFPAADIAAVDILQHQPEWPTGPGITYHVADQGDRTGIARLLQDMGREFDLVIEDGSHSPPHQVNCLAETLSWVRPGGLYVLEDLHTSMPQHALYQQTCAAGTPTSLHLLLFIEHLLANSKSLSPENAQRLSAPGMFTAEDVQQLAEGIAQVDFYHRASLPLRCYACGGNDFDPVALTCRCGVDLDVLGADSLTAVLRRVG